MTDETIDDFVVFMNIDPDVTATDANAIEEWLKSKKFEYKNGDGPGGSTVFKVRRKDYDEAVRLHAIEHSTSDFGEIYLKHKKRPGIF